MANHIPLSRLISQLQELQDELEGKISYDPLVKVHFQEGYPLKGAVARLNVIREDGSLHVSIAVGDCPGDENPYGSQEAWSAYTGIPEEGEEDHD